jgi:hypothetical protein
MKKHSNWLFFDRFERVFMKFSRFQQSSSRIGTPSVSGSRGVAAAAVEEHLRLDPYSSKCTSHP